MQDTKAKLGPLLGLLSSLAVLGAVALVLTRALGGEAEAARRISQTHLTIESIDEVLYALADAESSARGYAISRDTRLLSSLERSLAELRTGIRATKRLVIHDPSQASRVDGIERQLERRHDLFIEYRDAALRASEVPPISAESRQLSQDLRDALVQMKQEESRLLSERTSEVARERKSASTIELIGKSLNAGLSDQFGSSAALSSDNHTLVIGANQEASNATGINGDQTNNSMMNAGAVYVFQI